jgi:hypothetical protein
LKTEQLKKKFNQTTKEGLSQKHQSNVKITLPVKEFISEALQDMTLIKPFATTSRWKENSKLTQMDSFCKKNNIFYSENDRIEY